MSDLTKEQAKEAMENGQKVTHRYFSREEYIHIKDGRMYAEDGVRFEGGWNDRSGGNWETGWSIYEGGGEIK